MSTNSLLDKKILEVLVENGFSINDRGTNFYKEVVKAVVLYLRVGFKESEIIELQQQLLSEYSVFYFLIVKDIEEVSLEDFHKLIKSASQNSKLKNYMFFAFVLGQAVSNMVENDEDILRELASHKYVKEKTQS